MGTLFNDLSGKVFGRLSVVKRNGKAKDGHVRWECRCSCGKVVYISGNCLTRKIEPYRSCGGHSFGSENSKWRGYGEISGHYWSYIVREAKQRNLKVEITKETAWEKYVEQNGRCLLTGLPIFFGKDRTASLDRIDSENGYTVDNIQWLHKTVNRMKWVTNQGEFLRLCSFVVSPLSLLDNNIFIFPKHRMWTGAGNIPTWHIKALKEKYERSIKKRGLLFDDCISCELLWDLYVKQNGVCAITGIPIAFSRNSYPKSDGTASLDRINSGIGYVVGNMQWVHKVVNIMKSDLTIDEFKNWCLLIVKHSGVEDLSLKRSA